MIKPEMASYRRMIKAGNKPKAIRMHILQIAQERRLPKAEVRRALRASTSRGNVLIDFACKRDINLNWLIFGDIRGLILMKQRGGGHDCGGTWDPS